jgi:hypothetical protein
MLYFTDMMANAKENMKRRAPEKMSIQPPERFSSGGAASLSGTVNKD